MRIKNIRAIMAPRIQTTRLALAGLSAALLISGGAALAQQSQDQQQDEQHLAIPHAPNQGESAQPAIGQPANGYQGDHYIQPPNYGPNGAYVPQNGQPGAPSSNYGQQNKDAFVEPLKLDQAAWLKAHPQLAPGEQTPGIHIVTALNATQPAYLREFQETLIAVPKDERITDVVFGAPGFFEIDTNVEMDPKNGRLPPYEVAIRPRYADFNTNVLIMTANGDVYPIQTQVEVHDAKWVTDNVIIFRERPNYADPNAAFAAEPAAATTAAPAATGSGDAPTANPASPNERDMSDVTTKGNNIPMQPEWGPVIEDLEILARSQSDAQIAPIKVYRNNVFVYLEWGKKFQEARVGEVDRVEPDGSEENVPQEWEGTRLRITASGQYRFVYRRGDQAICIVQLTPNDLAKAATQ